ncbi:MAG: hypothetical protein KAJ23_18000, partial [Maribacter sp.]|nr:hypothetical protein [Maribacter sp.]
KQGDIYWEDNKPFPKSFPAQKEQILNKAKITSTSNFSNTKKSQHLGKDTEETVSPGESIKSKIVNDAISNRPKSRISKNEVFPLNNQNRQNSNIASNESHLRKSSFGQIESENNISAETGSLANKIPSNKKGTTRALKKDSSLVKLHEKIKSKKYFVYPFIGAFDYGEFSHASAIDARLDLNKKVSTITLGYGVHLIFIPKEKWSIRLGALYQGIENETYNVPLIPNDLSTNFYNSIALEDNLSYTSFSNSFSQVETISLKEKLGYLEIPVEIGYTFYATTNIEIDAIVGVGVLFSKKNELYAVGATNKSILLGKNKNYSKGSFGLHLGLGLNYQVSESFKIQMEPIFKPQIGLYSTSNGTSPFIFSLRIGARYKL